jgi:hypothetical protein
LAAVSGIAAQAARPASAGLPDAPEPQSPPAAEKPKPNPGTAKHLNAIERFYRGPRGKSLTAREKGWLAARNLMDPFNLITIGGEAGISVAADPDSPYGPGMAGYGRYVGVSFTEAMTGEFFGTFLIPAVTHQDPRYHRMKGKPIPQRVWHTVEQVLWTEGDRGKMMPNYANLAGFAIDDEIANLYVPGRKTDVGASAERYGIGLALVPVENGLNEFLPDVASHVHVRIVALQRIINQVARSAGEGSTSGP